MMDHNFGFWVCLALLALSALSIGVSIIAVLEVLP